MLACVPVAGGLCDTPKMGTADLFIKFIEIAGESGSVALGYMG
jgi:hypothetical protein